MNTSRDIEKLFDHFGGNAGDYQEIGRENEAKSARTRWPLLATLDFAQPTIPGIAPRRDPQPSALRAPAAEPGAEPAERPTPIHRGRPQLFTRPHRRTIPPVSTPAAESLSALRFSARGDSASSGSETIPASAAAPATSVPPVQAPAESKPVADDASTSAHAPQETARAAATFGSSFLARRAAVAETPAQAPRARSAAEPAPHSILGKLFTPQAPQVADAPANSLQSMFDRLRHANEPTNTQASAGHAARASRLSRS